MIFRFSETKKIPLQRWNFYLKLIQYLMAKNPDRFFILIQSNQREIA